MVWFVWLVFMAALFILPVHAKVPVSYAGRPPTVHTPGHCWCRWHGPRGGCVRWVCHKERK